MHFPLEYNSALFSFVVVVCFGWVGQVLINAVECADVVHIPLEYDSALFPFIVCFGLLT